MTTSCRLPLLKSTSFLALTIFLFANSAAFAQQFVRETITRFPAAVNNYSNQLSIADIDGDGDLDLAIANGSGFASPGTMQPLQILINDGNGFFSDETLARTGGLVSYGRDVEFGDVDQDGDLDAIWVSDFNQIPRLLINDGAGFFTSEPARIPQIALSCPHAAFGDVDNDGDLDLWLAKGGSSRFGAGQSQLWLNDGLGFFTNATATHLPQQLVGSPMDCLFGDLDGDFDLDVVAGHRDTNSKLYRNDGSGIFTDISAGNMPNDDNTYSYDLGDLDGDGDLDMLGVNSMPGSARDTLFINDGNMSFTNMTLSLLPNSSNPFVDDNDSKFFDIDNDGDLDFIIGSLGGTERICINNGAGSFTLQAGTITAVSDSTMDVEVADLDGDGRLDIVTVQGESGSFTNQIYMNTGPVDTLPPTFPAIEQVQDILTAESVVVRVCIRDGMTSDSGAFFKETKLLYSSTAGETGAVDLYWMGGDLYRGTLPALSGFISYTASATDFADNVGQSETLSYENLQPTDFSRGDCNADGSIDISDAISQLDQLFAGGAAPLCADSCDNNDDGLLNIADPVSLLEYLFSAGIPLPAPGALCGSDPTADALNCGQYSCP